MGEIIMLQGVYPYQLPDVPKDKKQIINWDKPKSDQFWQRPLRPNLKRMSPRERLLYIDEERRRLDEGVWMFLNGTPVYLTKGHYDFLMYGSYSDFDGDPKYYDAQRYDFYFKEFVENDPNCFGEIVIKPRRYGYTAIAIAQAITKAMSNFGMHVGMVSTDKDKVIETIFRPLTESYFSRPKYARADVYTPNGKPPQKELRFVKNVLEEEDAEDDGGMVSEFNGLKSWISPRATTAKAFDGHKWHLVILDEIYKWTKADLYNTWKITKEALQVGGRIVGKAALFATMGDDDTYDKAIEAGIKLWNESDYNDRNKYGRSKSGLYRYFIPAFVAFEMFIDKFGICDQEAAKEYLEDERRSIAEQYGEDSLEYIYHIRKYPFTAEEAMSSVKSTSTFSRIRITSRENTLTILSHTQKPYVTGLFTAAKGNDIGARFEPSREALWKIAHHPHKEARNRIRQINNKFYLPKNPEFILGNDPVRTADNVSGHLSKNAAYVFQKYDYYNTGNQNKLCAQLFGRDEDVDLFNEQIRLASLYYSCPVATERQINSTEYWFSQRKMKHFILEETKGVHGVWTSAQIIKDGIEDIQAYIKRPKDPEEIDYLDTIVFEELLEQLKEFEKAKSTKYDAVMGLIITFWGAKKIKYMVQNTAGNRRAHNAMSVFAPVRN